MNYLSLCQRLKREVGASGNESTVVNATGEWARLCGWIATAYSEIQLVQPYWNWLRAETSFSTIANQAEYPHSSAPVSLTNFSRWKDRSFRIYKGSVQDEHILDHWDYDRFRDVYLLSTTKTEYSYPSIITVSPSDSLILALPPDSVYTVTGEYFKNPEVLVNDNDIPGLPDRFHMLIVYRAMQEYGFYESAQEVIQRATARYAEMLARLRYDETEDITFDRDFIS